MATGYTFPQPLLAPSGSEGGTALLPTDIGGVPGVLAVAGPLTDNTPVAGRTRPITGFRHRTFFDDYYNRVHVIPPVVDFASISADESFPVMLWNARLTGVVLTGIALDDTTQGVTVSGNALPRALTGLEVATYSVNASGLGPSEITVRGTFGFDNGEFPDVLVIGSRSALLPFAPNWRDGYTYRMEFKTDVFTSRSGKEQRRAQRSSARKQFGFTITADRDQMRLLDRFVYTWQDRAIVIPDLLRQARSLAGMPMNGTQIQVTETPEWLVAGASVVLVDGTQQSQRKVLSVANDLVTFTIESPTAFSAATRIHPAVVGRMAADIKVDQITDEVVEVQMNVAGLPGIVPDDQGTPVDVFNGREILTVPHNWARSVSGSFLHSVDTVDFDRGRTQTLSPVAFGTRTQQFGFTLGTVQQVAGLTQFFARMKGQRGEFYATSNSNDLILAESLPSGEIQLKIDGTDVYFAYFDDTVHRAITVSADGWPFAYARKIANFVNTGTQTILELEAPLPIDIEPGRVSIGWLRNSRFAVDQLELRAATDAVAETQLAVRTLEDLTPEGNLWDGIDAGARWLIDYYGWIFTNNVIINPVHQWVHVEYPRTAGVSVIGDGVYWLNRWYGQPYATTEVTAPLHEFVNVTLPDYFPEN